MMNVELLSDCISKASLQRRRKTETERRERIFNDKVRTIGVSYAAGAEERPHDANSNLSRSFNSSVLAESKSSPI